jgi:hypothetical protein
MKIKTVVVSGVLLSMVACSSAGFGTMRGDEYGIIEIKGDARGIEAYHQGLQGTIEAAKNAEGKASSAHSLYVTKEVERTKRMQHTSPFAQFLGMGGQ